MSMVRCQICGRRIDTDYHEDAVVFLGSTIVCLGCFEGQPPNRRVPLLTNQVEPLKFTMPNKSDIQAGIGLLVIIVILGLLAVMFG